ncbi:MAG: hypothetical protein M1820_000925 [Bogoriella megaspora]|nr:MAG: hypothetical protein M1820_000925 [Bogoriella megaspora]
MSTFENLPTEVIVEIYKQVNLAYVIPLSQTSSRLRSIWAKYSAYIFNHISARDLKGVPWGHHANEIAKYQERVSVCPGSRIGEEVRKCHSKSSIECTPHLPGALPQLKLHQAQRLSYNHRHILATCSYILHGDLPAFVQRHLRRWVSHHSNPNIHYWQARITEMLYSHLFAHYFRVYSMNYARAPFGSSQSDIEKARSIVRAGPHLGDGELEQFYTWFAVKGVRCLESPVIIMPTHGAGIVRFVDPSKVFSLEKKKSPIKKTAKASQV